MVRGVATVGYAGAITAAAVERNQNAGRGIATAAGVPIGALAGITVLGVVLAPAADGNHLKRGSVSAGDKILGATVLVGGTIAGSVIGGFVAHSLAASPGARAPLTAVALAPMYLTTLVMTVDW